MAAWPDPPRTITTTPTRRTSTARTTIPTTRWRRSCKCAASARACEDTSYRVLQGRRTLTITQADLDAVAYVANPRTYRVTASGESGKVKKKITAIVDTGRVIENPMTLNPSSEQAAGVLQY